MAAPRLLSVFILLLTVVISTGYANQNTNKGYIKISGKLPTVIPNDKKPYLVTSSIEVPKGQTTIIEKGVVFLFKNFTGITIHGSIHAEGTRDQPVIFTSENDSIYNPTSSLEPAPYDWDGIVVNDDDTVSVFEFAYVKFSLFGINSNTRNIVLRECTFIENGKADFSVQGKEPERIHGTFNYIPDRYKRIFEPKQPIPIEPVVQKPDTTPQIYKDIVVPPPTTPLDYPGKAVMDSLRLHPSTSPTASRGDIRFQIGKNDSMPQPRPVLIGKDTMAVTKRVPASRWFGITFALAGLAVGVYEGNEFYKAYKEFDKINNDDGVEGKFQSAQWEDAWDRMEFRYRLMAAGCGVAGVGIVMITFSF